MSELFVNPTAGEIGEFLRGVRRAAVVGLSPIAERPSHRVAAAMQSHGWEIVPVRPATDKILGERCWPTLSDVPEPVDLVDVFRASQHVPQIVDQAIACSARGIWLQEGVINHEQALRARAAGLWVVMDRCVWKDYLDYAS
jgi:predicted CoA-binding protein